MSVATRERGVVPPPSELAKLVRLFLSLRGMDNDDDDLWRHVQAAPVHVSHVVDFLDVTIGVDVDAYTPSIDHVLAVASGALYEVFDAHVALPLERRANERVALALDYDELVVGAVEVLAKHTTGAGRMPFGAFTAALVAHVGCSRRPGSFRVAALRTRLECSRRFVIERESPLPRSKYTIRLRRSAENRAHETRIA